MSARRVSRGPRSKRANYVNHERSVFCPIYEERLDLHDCFLRYFAARSRKNPPKNNCCINCPIIAERTGDLHKIKIMRVLKERAPGYVDLAMLAKKTDQHPTNLETILRTMTAAEIVEASLVYCRGAVRPRKIYRLKPDPNAAERPDLDDADEVCDDE